MKKMQVVAVIILVLFFTNTHLLKAAKLTQDKAADKKVSVIAIASGGNVSLVLKSDGRG